MKGFLHNKLSLCTSNQISNQENPLEGIPTQKNMAELTRLMSEQIVEEIDNEVVNILTGRINRGQRA